MNVVRQRLRRFGRPTGAETRSALSDCIVRSVSFGADPLETLAAESAADGIVAQLGADGYRAFICNPSKGSEVLF